ncbi:MAG: AI-2E family transporter [Candidatus Kaiserbacteria bacterium]|nr:MAG: AI-2E family transporter [Candidatus Kaiserbacteria bacterium]
MSDRPLSISITTGTVIKALLVLAGAWLLFELRDLVLILITAVVIASALEPAVARVRRYKVPRVLSVLLVYIVVLGLFFGLFFFFVPTVFSEFAAFLSSVPSYIDSFNQISAFDQYASIIGIEPPTVSTENLLASIRDSLGESGVFGNALTAIASIFGGLLSFLLIIVFSFYFAVIETGVDDFLQIIVPKQHRSYVLDLWSRSRQKIALWMQGQLLLAVLIGVLVYLLLTIFGIKHALLLAVVAAVFELIPVFGPTLAALPAVLIAFADGGAIKGVTVIIVYVLLQQFENHLIYPLVVTRVVGVPPLLVILALIIGAELAGFLGILLSVPVAAVIQEFVRDWQEEKAFTGEVVRRAHG